MKTIKQISKILIAILIIITSINSSFAQERKNSFEKTYKLNSTGEFTFSCYDTDLKVNTWEKDEVKLMGVIIIEGGDKDDQDKLIDVFKNPETSQSANSLKIETNMSTFTVIIGPYRRTTLVNGTKIKVKKYKVNYTLWLPKSVAFNLKSKYNSVDIATLTGKIDFQLYDVDLTLASFNKGVFDMKYSSAEIGKGESAKFDLYECEIEIKNINVFSTNTKYSKFYIENVSLIALGSYEDKFKILNITDELIGKAKYSDFLIKSNINQIKMDVYESDIEAKNIKKLIYSSKYSSLKALNIGSAKCERLYEAKIYASTVGDFSCSESKYDKIEFEAITKSIDFTNAYELKLKVGKVDPSFESFSGEFKYGSVDMNLDPSLEFILDFETTYGNVKFPEERFRLNDYRTNGNESKKSFKASTSENAKCKIKFSAYDTDFDFTGNQTHLVNNNRERIERTSRSKRPSR